MRHVLKGIQAKQPTINRPPIWNVNKLIDYLNNYNIAEDSLFEVSRHVAVLLLLSSGRRVHDLTLLEIGPQSYIDLETEIILWPKFGSKTDTSNHQQSGWKLLKNSNQKIDLVHWIHILIKMSNHRRSDKNIKNLFITTRGKVQGASRTVIAGWIRTLLLNAGISASAGSFRAAVASDILHKKHESIDEILKRGNWKSQNTVFNHYFREIDSLHALSPRINPMLQTFASI